MLAAHGAENRSVLNIHEDLSTEATTQFPTEVEFRKKSTDFSTCFKDASTGNTYSFIPDIFLPAS
ncbi:hypothetical protein [Wolbachia endosymbiont of Folsomia candida]|uniref:hypothetical protein n=1 Tax=Wolbachia endosymbiont of Folsomia candida TaxID=169402 RepID=UPI000B5EC5CD|nr:hypothetical protein [Wolbachia endosymbiont of Folsomia candida]